MQKINKRTPFLGLYKESQNIGKLPHKGLCSCLDYMQATGTEREIFLLFTPTSENDTELKLQGLSTGYWGSLLNTDDGHKYNEFTEMRKMVLLFCAYINNEY